MAADLARSGAAPPPDAPPVERQLAFDMVRRGLLVAPVLVLLATLVWGGDGAWSALVAIAIVLANLVLAAVSLSWAARVSLTLLYVAALGGFLVRMGLVVAVVFAVKEQPWIDLTALGICVLVTHLGLLVWETRYISASLAFPGLRPGTPKEATSSR
jgi:hypothetical protein